jgi:hypothetical protein
MSKIQRFFYFSLAEAEMKQKIKYYNALEHTPGLETGRVGFWLEFVGPGWPDIEVEISWFMRVKILLAVESG